MSAVLRKLAACNAARGLSAKWRAAVVDRRQSWPWGWAGGNFRNLCFADDLSVDAIPIAAFDRSRADDVTSPLADVRS